MKAVFLVGNAKHQTLESIMEEAATTPDTPTNSELRTQIEQHISFAIQGTQEYTPKDITDYYANKAKWVAAMADVIMQFIADRREAADD